MGKSLEGGKPSKGISGARQGYFKWRFVSLLAVSSTEAFTHAYAAATQVCYSGPLES